MRRCHINNEQVIKFYAAEMVLAIEYVHKNGIMFGFIKPANILLEKDGHIKMTAYGLQNIHYKYADNSFTKP